MLKLMALAVVNPDVFEAYLRSDSFFTAELFGLIESGVIIPLFDSRLLDGYNEVLRSTNSENGDKALQKLVRGGFLVEDIGRTAAEIEIANELVFFEIKEPPEDPDTPIGGNAVSPQVVLGVLSELNKTLYRMGTREAREHNAELLERFLSQPNFISGKKLAKDLFGD